MENQKQVDARGKACPIPVVMAKKETEKGIENFTILVDNQTAMENLKRFGNSSGYKTTVSEKGSDFEIFFAKSEDSCGCTVIENFRDWAVFVGKEGIGDGEPELGTSLMKMFFYTLAQENDIPSYILFMNAGVKVPVENEQVVEQLKVLSEMGTQILVCGTCLNYYKLTDKLQIGNVSNMYDITSAMKTVEKVITL